MDDYPDAIRDMIRGQNGIYALYRHDKLYYVGLASNLMARLKSHLKDRHGRAWNRFSVYLTSDDKHMRELEALLLRIVNPQGNRATGRLTGAQNLYNILNEKMSDHDANRRARMLGGSVARRRRKTKTAEARGTLTIAGLADRGIKLRNKYKEKEYTAQLRTDGQINYNGKLYGSPSAAAKAAVGKLRNGWNFWHYRNEKKKWVKLAKLRK